MGSPMEKTTTILKYQTKGKEVIVTMIGELEVIEAAQVLLEVVSLMLGEANLEQDLLLLISHKPLLFLDLLICSPTSTR
jgi:hypothetical protein